MALLVDIGTQW